MHSCDTFVALPPATSNGEIIFGKNSDRPKDEVQEILYVQANDHEPGCKVECTYIAIDQVEHTYAVILSKPAWIWGAEMGANEHGLCIGNEAVWTKMCDSDDLKRKLLGMDFVRLALERVKTAKEATHLIGDLLNKYGQGGECFEDPSNPSAYQNSFLLADKDEAWVLETAGSVWAAERITSGVRNISNELSIRTKIDAISSNCKDVAKSKGWWNPDEAEFDFAKVFSNDFDEEVLGDSPCGRYSWGKKLLKDMSENGNFNVKSMIDILCHSESGICMNGSFRTTSSQVSIISSKENNTEHCHWFTGTPNPRHSLFKPFIFSENVSIGDKISSPQYGCNDPRYNKPPFQTKVDRSHLLWNMHSQFEKRLNSIDAKAEATLKQIKELEGHMIDDMQEVANVKRNEKNNQLAVVFQHMVDMELNFYS